MEKMWRKAAPVLALVLASGCGASGGKTMDTAAVEESALGVYEDAAEVAEAVQQAQQSDRKLIRTVDMDVETESFDELLQSVEQKVGELGGYIEQSDVHNGSYTSNYRSRNARITARIPADCLDAFLDDVAARASVTDKSEYTEDVTLQYVDLESHRNALRAEEASLLAMLEQAESLEDILEIRGRLTEIRYQLESMESQLRTYDNKIDYSTVSLYVEEVAQYAPNEQKSAADRIGEGFMKNVHRVGDGLKNFVIEFIIALPLLAAAAVIIGLMIAVVFAIVRVSERQAAKKKMKQQTEKERDRRPDGKQGV